MSTDGGISISGGNLSGRMIPALAAPEFLKHLEDFRSDPALETIRGGRNTLYRLRLDAMGQRFDLGIKSFGREALVKQWLDRQRGSKAERSWRIASRLAAAGVGTPAPIGFLERWEGRRLWESYFISAFREGVPTFKEELIRLYRNKGLCSDFMRLMQVVASAVRKMHDAGVLHRDLGNQNIFVRPLGNGDWGEVEFFDLNRARVVESPDAGARGEDMARIYLPSDFMRVFMEMYWAPVAVPEECIRAERSTRASFARHTCTRKWRHPIREARRRREQREEETYPPEKEMWVWDDRSGQPVSVLGRKDRLPYYPRGRSLQMAWASLRVLPGLKQEYLRSLAESFSRPIAMKNRIGIAIQGEPETWEKEKAFLDALGPIPVLMRLYHHDPANAEAAVRIGEALSREGRDVAFAMVQDRAAVCDSPAWERFVHQMMERVAPFAASVEMGHAVNRSKWGLWGPAEYQALAAPFQVWKERCPNLILSGPACIDFEYPYVAACLHQLPEGMMLDALSHHLYVDRRGPPEAFQGRFDTLRKLALLRALARRSGRCGDRLMVSEVNWPLRDTGEWSPVTSPYDTPGIVRKNDPSVSEDDYANYMVRYLLCALCSGHAERVYWWRLVARGFGLVDDSEAGSWRARPAYTMLLALLRHIGDATFRGRDVAANGAQRYRFEGGAGKEISVQFAPFSATPIPSEWESTHYLDAFGAPMSKPELLTGRPCFAGHDLPLA